MKHSITITGPLSHFSSLRLAAFACFFGLSGCSSLPSLPTSWNPFDSDDDPNQPVELLTRTNNEVMEIPEGHICCGSAGTYNILQSKIAKELLRKKVKNIESLEPDFISTGNIGCITQIANGTKTPILHTIEILDWYTGGPKPKILQRN